MAKRKLLILHVIRQGQIGGGETHVLQLVKHLPKESYTNIVLAYSFGEMIDELRKVNVRSYVIPTNKPFDIRIWKKVTLLLGELQPDIIHAHGSRAVSNVLFSARKRNIPVIYTIHGWSFHEGQSILRKAIAINVEKYLTKYVDLNIAVSHMNKETGIKYLGKFNGEVIQNCVDINKFDPERSDLKNVRKEFSISESDTVIGYFVRITKQKDPQTLIKAISKLAKKYSNLKLLMVGDGDLKEKVLNLIDQLELRDFIIIDGFRKDIPDLLHAIDIYCLPSLWEGLPIGLLEAMSMRKAVIASNVDGTKEVVKNYENGILFAPGDVNNLALELTHLHENRTLRTKLQNNAYEFIKTNFSIDVMINKVDKVYRNFDTN